jgi:peptide deformylase
MLGSGELIEIVADMFAEMRAAPGVGLAAPQIGVDLQVDIGLLDLCPCDSPP